MWILIKWFLYSKEASWSVSKLFTNGNIPGLRRTRVKKEGIDSFAKAVCTWIWYWDLITSNHQFVVYRSCNWHLRMQIHFNMYLWERSGSVVECLTRDWRAAPASLRCGPWARHIYPSLVLVQPRKTRPCLTERLLMGLKKSNQTKHVSVIFCHCYTVGCITIPYFKGLCDTLHEHIYSIQGY